MPTGSALTVDLARLMPEYDDSVAAEKTRALGHASVRQKEIAVEIRATDENYFLVSATFATVAARSPNRYSLPDDFGDMRHLERVLDDTVGSYKRIFPVGVLEHKDMSSQHVEVDDARVDTSTATGTPQSYLLGGDFLQLRPISDDAYTLRIWYDKTLGDIAAGMAIGLPLAFYPVLLYGTAVEERLYRRDDPASFESRYEVALARALRGLEQRSDDGPRRVTYQDSPSEIC